MLPRLHFPSCASSCILGSIEYLRSSVSLALVALCAVLDSQAVGVLFTCCQPFYLRLLLTFGLMDASYHAKLTTAKGFLTSMILMPEGALQIQDSEVNAAYRWWFIPQSVQLVLVFDFAMGSRPRECMCLDWTESNFWVDKHGNYLLLLSQTGWAMDPVFRTSLPRSGMDAFEKQPTAAFHWLTGKTFREFIVGFADGRCAYYGSGHRWTQPHGSFRTLVLGDRTYLLVNFHYLGEKPNDAVKVFEMAEGAYYRPVDSYKQRHTFVRLLREHSRGDIIVSLEDFEPLKMPKVVVLPFVNY